MPRFRLKPVEVEAEPYRLGLEDEWAHAGRYSALLGSHDARSAVDASPSEAGRVPTGMTVPVLVTSAGRFELVPGDWIVTTETGERQVVNAQVFQTLYQPCPAVPRPADACAETDRRVRRGIPLRSG